MSARRMELTGAVGFSLWLAAIVVEWVSPAALAITGIIIVAIGYVRR